MSTLVDTCIMVVMTVTCSLIVNSHVKLSGKLRSAVKVVVSKMFWPNAECKVKSVTECNSGTIQTKMPIRN